MINNYKEYTTRQYNLEKNIKKYGKAIEDIKLWNSEKTIFTKYIPKNATILDIGCGAGRTTINLYKNGYKNIIGIDIADKLLNYAQEYCQKYNLPIHFEIGNATNLRFDNNTFDIVIFSFNGMQCIPGQKNRAKVLKEVYRVLKPNGLYIFTAHDRHDPRLPEYLHFWKKIEENWSKNSKNAGAECLGDLIAKDPNDEEAFLHFSTIDEMKDFVLKEPFEIVAYDYSYNIAQENPQTIAFAGNTVFWILRKK